MKRAGGGELSLLFLDASYFVIGCDFLGHIYGRVRRYVRTFSGRKRCHVLGATEVCEMLKKVTDESVGEEVHIVLDNARCPKCRMVQELAVQLGIQLEYIPPYGPNLNLIERVWKFVKGEISSKYYATHSNKKLTPP